jgi:hypothetical protein
MSEDTILIGLIGASGIIIGSIITILDSNHIAKKTHDYSLEKLKEEHKYRLRYLKDNIFYKKKIEYCEKLTSKLEETKNNMRRMMEDIQEGKIPQIDYLLGIPSYGEYSLIFETIDLLERVNMFKELQEKFGKQMIKTLKERDKKEENLEILEDLYLEVDSIIFDIADQMRIELGRKIFPHNP